jgi:hypothetical protein
MVRTGLLAIAMLAVVAACGGPSAEEELMQRLIENAGEDVSNIDIGGPGDDFDMTIEGTDGETISISGGGEGDDFDVTIEGGDGATSVSGSADDGTITIQGEEGETMTIGGGEIPAALQIPVPAGGEVVSTIESGSDVTVTLVYPMNAHDGIVAFYDEALDPASDEVTRSETSFTGDDGDINSVYWSALDATSWTVTLSTCYGIETGILDSTCLVIYQTQ